MKKKKGSIPTWGPRSTDVLRCRPSFLEDTFSKLNTSLFVQVYPHRCGTYVNAYPQQLVELTPVDYYDKWLSESNFEVK